MNLLLDTHVFLWFISDDPRLKPSFAAAIISGANDVYLSCVSVWEATIKQQNGKLPLPRRAPLYMPDLRIQHDIQSLPVTEEDLTALFGLPLHHRDPFDRLIVAQAIYHNLVIVTDDIPKLQYKCHSLVDG